MRSSLIPYCKCGMLATVEFKSWEDPTAQGEGPLVWQPSCMACVPDGVSSHSLTRLDLRGDTTPPEVTARMMEAYSPKVVRIKSAVAAEKYLKRIARFLLPSKPDVVYEVMVDVYDVAAAYNVTDGPIHHALKKILCPGQRGVKSEKQDLEEAIQCLRRQIEILDTKKE